MPIYKYYEGYREAQQQVEQNSMEDNLQIIDSLFGRDELKFGDGEYEVKQETLRQLEIEYREEVNETATFWSDVIKANKHNNY